MPRFDRTGPGGSGTRTGWGRGPCGQGMGQRWFSWSGVKGGVGRGGSPWSGGRGRCLGNRSSRFPFSWGVSETPVDEAEALKAEIESAKEEIAAMEARLQDLMKKE